VNGKGKRTKHTHSQKKKEIDLPWAEQAGEKRTEAVINGKQLPMGKGGAMRRSRGAHMEINSLSSREIGAGGKAHGKDRKRGGVNVVE